MHERIDLTPDRDFRQAYEKVLRGDFGAAFPWGVGLSPHEDEDVIETVVTGNKEVRELKRMYRGFEGGTTCARCGEPTDTLPWRPHYGLCRECEHIVSSESGAHLPFPWDNDTANETDWLCGEFLPPGNFRSSDNRRVRVQDAVSHILVKRQPAAVTGA